MAGPALARKSNGSLELQNSAPRMTAVIPAMGSRVDAPGAMNARRSIGPSPFTRFRRDHSRVLARLGSLEAAAPGSGRGVDEPPIRRHLASLARQFDTHMAVEESVLYPMLARALPSAAGSLHPLHDEHADLREMLADLWNILDRPRSHDRDVQIAVQVRDLVDLLRVHIRKEESVVFDVSERVLRPSELRGLRRRLTSLLPARKHRATAREKGKTSS